MANKRPMITFEDCRLVYKNFEGREGMYNKKGDRSFSIVLPDDQQVEALVRDGWNVKFPKPKEDLAEGEEDTRSPTLPVALGFDKFPPNIFLITSRARTKVTEEMAETLDWIDMDTVDVVVNGSFWDVNGKSGVKAYLKTMFITMAEDDLERKYGMVGDPIDLDPMAED